MDTARKALDRTAPRGAAPTSWIANYYYGTDGPSRAWRGRFAGGCFLAGGAVVAVVYPTTGSIKPGEWSDALNDRRIDLIDKDIEQTITAAERVELADLQRKAIVFRDQVAPLPMDGARQLHRRLLETQHRPERGA